MSPDTTKRVPLHITPRTNAAAWSCHMNNFKILNAKKLNVSAKRGAGRLILFGSNGETAPVKSYRSATDPVTVRLFKSGSLPPSLAPVRRELAEAPGNRLSRMRSLDGFCARSRCSCVVQPVFRNE